MRRAARRWRRALPDTPPPLLGKPLPLRFREVRDADGMVYYLATQRVTRPDTLRFILRVTPAGAAPIEVDFSRDFP